MIVWNVHKLINFNKNITRHFKWTNLRRKNISLSGVRTHTQIYFSFRAGIQKYFCLVFGSNEKCRICFRDYLSFRVPFQSGFRDLKNDRIWCCRFFQTEQNGKKSVFRASHVNIFYFNLMCRMIWLLIFRYLTVSYATLHTTLWTFSTKLLLNKLTFSWYA